MTPPEQSNYLPDLAARIRAEHEATSEALKTSVQHAIAAGELLIEAKDKVQHGQWLPWLMENCAISERTAQLYMRVAKNREAVERQIRNEVADLTLNEAAALLFLSSDAIKLLDFAKQAQNLPGQDFLDFCVQQNVAVINSANYDPLAGRSDTEKLDWHLFMIFLSFDSEAGRPGLNPEHACMHVEYLLQRPFQNVDEWLGPEGDGWRARTGSPNQVTDKTRAVWASFKQAYPKSTLADLHTKLNTLQERFDRAERAGLLNTGGRKRRRHAA